MPRGAALILVVVAALSCCTAVQLTPRPPEACRGAAGQCTDDLALELRSRATPNQHAVAPPSAVGVEATPSEVGVEANHALRLRGGGSWSSWFKGLLSKLGIFSKTGKLLVLGLDNAGKSTLLTLLVRNEVTL